MSRCAPLYIGVTGMTDELTSELAGSKATQLWRMTKLGLTVPPAFVLPIELCASINRDDSEALHALRRGLREGVAKLEETTGRRFGDDHAPLLVSVRSGAAKSMPGMLATILNIGLNAESVRGLIVLTGNPRLAWDSYRRFIQNYCEIVGSVGRAIFDNHLADMIRSEMVDGESDLDSEALERLAREFGALATHAMGHAIPEEPSEQLEAAARAVYRSWDNARSKEYRRLNKLEGLTGTAITIQSMVFGNAGSKSGAGVAFSRNPATGVNELYVDFLPDAQGEDVVAGQRRPGSADWLIRRLPQVASELANGALRLEREFRDVQDIEFTVENGKLFFLQTRSAKRTPRAALHILVDFVKEGLLDPSAALSRVAEIDLERARITHFASKGQAIASALSASPGVATGRIAFDSGRAKVLAAGQEPVILARPDTSTDDVEGFAVAAGILTASGGRTAHAAVVARQLGRVCLVGCRDLKIAEDRKSAEIAGEKVMEGDWISLDGDTGKVILGRLGVIAELPQAELAAIDQWRHGADRP